MRKLLYAFVVGLAVATVVWFGVGVLTTWTVIHNGRSESAIRSYFVGVGIASLAIGILAGSWWYRWLRKRAARASISPLPARARR
jgi:protein-S-isoprenylcysteine O-methyltransferase Ste14